MDTLLSIIQGRCQAAIQKVFSDIDPQWQIAEVTPCMEETLGQYQCNNALKLGKLLHKNPKEIADSIRLVLSSDPIFSSVTVAGPGFINITLTPAFLSQELNQALHDPHLGAKIAKTPSRIIIDFSSPNIAKELHVGHLRSTIIGDCLARLFEFLGHDVLRLNHVGDWGSQFGMLITYLKKEHPDILQGTTIATLPDLTIWYKESKKRFDEDPIFKKESQNEVVSLQSGEKEALFSWKVICDISRKAFQEIYDILDVKILERGESFYNPFLPGIILDLEKKGIIQISDGAKCIFLTGFTNREGNPLPIMIQKSDGAFNYDTTDLAGFRHRVEVEKADRIIIVTDAGQSLHFKMIHEAAVLAGYIDPKKTSFDHVPFGLVLGSDGKKFRTRSGKTEKLIDLLTEAMEHASKILQERIPDLEEKEAHNLGQILGIDAIKYADLSCHRVKDYLFSYERMLKFEGNTAPFLLYAYVRIMGIKRKTQAKTEEILQSSISLKHPSEIALGLHLRKFGENLDMLTTDLLPNRLCDYLYELAEKFHAFFRDCRVEGSEEEKERLALCELTARILEKGLWILGLKTLYRM
ncbi:MAG: arginine--tRNA ligase [Chlamydiota bacterium]